MARLHLFGHMDLNKVRKGDKVSAYKTVIGTVGDGNGQYPNAAHLHNSISDGLTVNQLISYIKGWSKDKVKKYYIDPRGRIDYNRMFGIIMDVGKRGYDWLQWNGYGYHPGVDVNNPKGGNSDFGMEFTSPVDGIVVYEWRGWGSNKGWGNLIIIEERTDEIDYESNFKKILKSVGSFLGKDFGDKPDNKETDEIVEGLKNAK